MGADTGQLTLDVRKLGLFNRMAKRGASTVAGHLREMTGVEAAMEITKVTFVDAEDIKRSVGPEDRIGITVELCEPPHGEILFLFGATDAKTLARGMIGDMADAPPAATGFSEMERSAIQEIGNVMTSGFIDGWADVLETTIDISTPSFSVGPGSGMVEGTVGAREDGVALVFDSKIHGVDENLDLTIYAFPDLAELVDLMAELEA